MFKSRIRLYLECFGCGMIILGVLIILVSSKMKSVKRERNIINHEFVIHDFNCIKDYSSRQMPLASIMERSSREESTSQELETNFSGVADVFVVSDAPKSACDVNQKINSSVDYGRSKAGLGSKARLVRSSTSLIESTRFKLDDNNDVAEVVAPEAGTESWIPCNIKYGYGHHAAIEAALSTVLTVSTLVGFRVDQSCTIQHQYCCLHHMVKVSEPLFKQAASFACPNRL